MGSDARIGEISFSEIGALEAGGMLACQLGGRKIVLCRVEGALFAFENRCSHAAVELSSGRLEGHEIECPFHGARFDVRSGAALCQPARTRVAVFDVVPTDTGVEIRSRPAER